MDAKFGIFSEMANLLSNKSRVSGDLTAFYARFSLGHLLSRMGMKKEQGYSLVQLIMAICIFRVCGETIHSAYMSRFHGLATTGKIGEIHVRIFLIRYGHKQKWNVLITTNMSLSFVKAFEIYQMRWSIEVLNKETKQYLGLGTSQARDFDKLIADCTLCYMTYIVMALDKRINEYETTGQLFSVLKTSLIELTLWKRVLSALQRFVECLCEKFSIPVDELFESILDNDDFAQESLAMLGVIQSLRKRNAA